MVKEKESLSDNVEALKKSIIAYKSANTKYRAEIGALLKYKNAVADFNKNPWYKRIFAKKIVVE